MSNLDETVDRMQRILQQEFAFVPSSNSRRYIRSELLDVIRLTEDEARQSAFAHANSIGAKRREQTNG